MGFRRLVGLPLVLVPAIAGGCGLILGLDEFVDADPPGAGGTDGGLTCAPGDREPCYEGAAGTEGVGNCAPGERTCDPDGVWGGCEGQVLPATEDCNVRGDEDCDGNPCGDALWSRIDEGQGEHVATGIAVDPQGNLWVVGRFGGTLKFGSTSIIGAGSFDYFLAKFDRDGNVVWMQKFGNNLDNGTRISIAVDAQGNTAIAGELSGTANFGGNDLTSAGDTDVFVAVFDADGFPRWSKTFGDAATQRATSVAFDSQGNVIVGGDFRGTIGFGGPSLTSAGNLFDAFLVRLSGTSGSHQWTKQVGDLAGQSASYQLMYDIILDKADNILLTGEFGTSLDLGGQSLTDPDGNVMFIAKLDSSGGPAWAKKFIGSRSKAISVDTDGAPVVTGTILTSTDFGGGILTPQTPFSAFLVKFNSLGSHRWSAAYSTQAVDIAVDSWSNVIFASAPALEVDFGGGALPGSGSDEDFALTKFDPDGGHLWSKRFGDMGQQRPGAIAVDVTTGHVVSAAMNTSVLDVGNGPLISTGTFHVVVAKFAP